MENSDIDHTHPSLLIYMDDTFRPTFIDSQDEYEFIQKLYLDCDWDVEFEKITSVGFSELTKLTDITSNHPTYLHLNNKYNYINEYLPHVKQYLCIKEKINTILLKYNQYYPSKNLYKERTCNQHIDNSLTLTSGTYISEKLNNALQKLSANVDCNKQPVFYNKKTFDDHDTNFDYSNSHTWSDNSYDNYDYDSVNSYIDAYRCDSINYDDNIPPNKNETVVILINDDKCMKTLSLLNPPINIIQTINSHPECGFKILLQFSTNKTSVINYVFRFFDKLDVDPDTFIEQLDYCGNSIMSILNVTSDDIKEEQLVVYYIKNNYLFTDSISDRIKASVIADNIQHTVLTGQKCRGGFALRLSKYLSELGLKKKRFNDGFYYYGMILKTS